MSLLTLSDTTIADIENIWRRVKEPAISQAANVAWSFEGNGIRTRTTFVRAFRELGLSFTELPNFLKTDERAKDLAGYLDSFYEMYVIRESNHARLAEFANASRRPVINAMSDSGHPCEVLTDAYFIDSTLMPITQARICLWGPLTNIFRSWHELAQVFGIQLVHVCEACFHTRLPNVTFVESHSSPVDIVITDGWPRDLKAAAQALTLENLAEMGRPMLLPTPPFAIGRELSFDPLSYSGFVGYQQKELLLPVQKAILCSMLER